MAEVLIIVGAPRSGTNMLRDVLTSLPGFGTWDGDEINLMWKHGNVAVPHDELTPAHARPEVTRYLRRAFARLADRHHLEVVVEKTCATSLRVAFAATVFPDARFVFIRRDGIDATASAMRRWNAPFDLRYTVKKARYVPWRDFPVHASAFVAKRVKQRVGGVQVVHAAGAVSTWWGPRPADYPTLQRDHPLDEIAFIQWQRCVEATRRDLSAMPSSRWVEIVYEDFVADPQAGLRTILAFLGRPEAYRATAVSAVRDGSVGKGREQLGPKTVTRLTELGGATLADFGYA